MHQLSEAELTQKIDTFLSRKMPDRAPATTRFPEKDSDARSKSFFTRLSDQYTTLIGNQPILHR